MLDKNALLRDAYLNIFLEDLSVEERTLTLLDLLLDNNISLSKTNTIIMSLLTNDKVPFETKLILKKFI